MKTVAAGKMNEFESDETTRFKKREIILHNYEIKKAFLPGCCMITGGNRAFPGTLSYDGG